MILLLIILLTSFGGFALTLYLTSGFEPATGNPVAAVLVAIAIALFWSRGFMTLERDYLTGKFHKVKRKLLLWGTSLGVEEVALVRLFMAVEGKEQDEIQRCLDNARSLGLLEFVRAWTYGAGLRLQGESSKAVAAFANGAETVQGLDRVELLCEAGIALLQTRGESLLTARNGDLERAISFSNEADQILRELRVGREQMNRYRYAVLLQQTLRAMIYFAQGRTEEAHRRFNKVVSSARLLSSLRARRLAILCRIEDLPAVLQIKGEGVYRKEREAIRKASNLSLLRLRLSEVEARLERIETEEGPSDRAAGPFLSGSLESRASIEPFEGWAGSGSGGLFAGDRMPAPANPDSAEIRSGTGEAAGAGDEVISLSEEPDAQLDLDIPERT